MDTAVWVAGPPASTLADPLARTLALARFAAWRDPLERRLDALLPLTDRERTGVVTAMRDALLAPGKRLRPLLLLTAMLDLGADPADGLDAGCALEMVHAASLALDDLPCMDDAQMRRGRPTIHVAHGEDVAILAAVGLLARAFEVLATTPGIDAPARATTLAALAAAVGTDGLVGGQLEDLRGAGTRHTAADAQRCNTRKTAALFIAAIDIAAALAAAPRARHERLRGFALHLGCAFQLRDDVHDATRSSLELGKDSGRDAERQTMVGLQGVESTLREMHRHLAAARAAAGVEAGPGAPGPLVRFLDAAFGDGSSTAVAAH